MDEAADLQIKGVLGEVASAFFGAFPSLREIQRAVAKPIASGENILVCSATASGKTEAVVAPLVWRLRRSPRPPNARGPLLLAVAPTRALVNDLLRRLEGPCRQLGWAVAAQTGDHAGAQTRPEMLVTTPESFDSMLVRRSERGDDRVTTGHLLAGVEALFIDEAHCFGSSVRGDQLLFLIERLRRLRRSAREKVWTESDGLQVCGASATVSDPDAFARRMLGPGARAIVCAGARTIEVMLEDEQWHALDGMSDPASLRERVLRTAGDAPLGRILLDVLAERDVRKALVFVPSRHRCDTLAASLSQSLPAAFEVGVYAHHGSLTKTQRELAESGFGRPNARAVMIATSTLEVGIDIGDVDVVLLLGPPPDVSALMQRIGRGGRRMGRTRVIPVAENLAHAAALASMLTAAARGSLDGAHFFRHWSVFIQQAASYIQQNGLSGRPRHTLIELAAAAWPDTDTDDHATKLLDSLIIDRVLHDDGRGRLHVDERLTDKLDDHPGDLHSNIRSSAASLAVRDQATGDIVGFVAGLDPAAQATNIGGVARRVLSRSEDEIVVESAGSRTQLGHRPARYPSVPFLLTRAHTSHIASGLGWKVDEAPLLHDVGEFLWFHFGGQLVERLLRAAAPDVFRRSVVPGVALSVSETFQAFLQPLTDPGRLSPILREVLSTGRARFSQGRYDEFFSDASFPDHLLEWAGPATLASFFGSRSIVFVSGHDPAGRVLLELLM